MKTKKMILVALRILVVATFCVPQAHRSRACWGRCWCGRRQALLPLS